MLSPARHRGQTGLAEGGRGRGQGLPLLVPTGWRHRTAAISPQLPWQCCRTPTHRSSPQKAQHITGSFLERRAGVLPKTTQLRWKPPDPLQG